MSARVEFDPARSGLRALWFVGLPGAGKSAVAKAVLMALKRAAGPGREKDIVLLQMDERRKKYFPNPAYTAEEREKAYDMFAAEAAELARAGKFVLMDGAACKLSMRRKARQAIPGFAEIMLDCPLKTAMRREKERPDGLVMAGLYEKALERKQTGCEFPGLGQVVGVDVEFERDPEAELVINSAGLSIEQARDLVLKFIAGKAA